MVRVGILPALIFYPRGKFMAIKKGRKAALSANFFIPFWNLFSLDPSLIGATERKKLFLFVAFCNFFSDVLVFFCSFASSFEENRATSF